MVSERGRGAEVAQIPNPNLVVVNVEDILLKQRNAKRNDVQLTVNGEHGDNMAAAQKHVVAASWSVSELATHLLHNLAERNAQDQIEVLNRATQINVQCTVNGAHG